MDWGVAVACGLAPGVALGYAMDNVGLGIATGLAFGVAIGSVSEVARRRKNKTSDTTASDRENSAGD